MEIIKKEMFGSKMNAEHFSYQSEQHLLEEDESGFFENDDYSDEDGDDFIESGTSFFVTTDESFQKVESSQKLKETEDLVVNGQNFLDFSPELKETKTLEPQSESLLDKFENFFNNFNVDEDHIEKNKEEVNNIGDIHDGTSFAGGDDQMSMISHYYYCYFLLCPFKIQTGLRESENRSAYNHLLTIHGIQQNHQKFLSLEEKKDSVCREGLKWPIKICEVVLKNINSTNGNVKSDPSKNYLPSNLDENTETEESDNAHTKYLLDINQNETFSSLWKMHLEKFKDGFKCNSCIDSFSRKNDLKIHQKRKHPHISTKIPRNSPILVEHHKTTKSAIQTPIEKLKKVDNEPLVQTPMEESNETARSSKENLRKVVKCDFCDKEYERQAPLRKHILLHKCELCNINFSGSKWKRELSSHKKDQHRDNATSFSKFEDSLLSGESEMAQSTPLPKRIRLSQNRDLNVSF